MTTSRHSPRQASAPETVVRPGRVRPNQQVFTTGSIAKLCQVAIRTVTRWIDSGALRGYRIPGTQDRRVPRDALRAFLVAHGMPLGELAGDADRLLAVGVDDRLVAELGERLGRAWTVRATADAWTAGLACEELDPTALLLGEAVGTGAGRVMAQHIRGKDAAAVVVAVRPDDQPAGWLNIAGVIEMPAEQATAAALAGALLEERDEPDERP
jgi:excisionase family DNA binding protein